MAGMNCLYVSSPQKPGHGWAATPGAIAPPPEKGRASQGALSRSAPHVRLTAHSTRHPTPPRQGTDGYHSIEVTGDICGHLVPDFNRAEVDRLDEPRDHTPEATIRNLSATTPTDSVLPERLSA
jgi:hypothetical protein